jgi:hypothetical protein
MSHHAFHDQPDHPFILFVLGMFVASCGCYSLSTAATFVIFIVRIHFKSIQFIRVTENEWITITRQVNGLSILSPNLQSISVSNERKERGFMKQFRKKRTNQLGTRSNLG